MYKLLVRSFIPIIVLSTSGLYAMDLSLSTVNNRLHIDQTQAQTSMRDIQLTMNDPFYKDFYQKILTETIRLQFHELLTSADSPFDLISSSEFINELTITQKQALLSVCTFYYLQSIASQIKFLLTIKEKCIDELSQTDVQIDEELFKHRLDLEFSGFIIFDKTPPRELARIKDAFVAASGAWKNEGLENCFDTILKQSCKLNEVIHDLYVLFIVYAEEVVKQRGKLSVLTESDRTNMQHLDEESKKQFVQIQNFLTKLDLEMTILKAKNNEARVADIHEAIIATMTRESSLDKKLEAENEAYRQFLAHIKSFEGSENASVSSSQSHSKSDSLNTSLGSKLGSKLEEKIDESQKARADDDAVEESAKPSENGAKQVQEDDRKEPQIIADNSGDQDSEPNDEQSTHSDDNSIKSVADIATMTRESSLDKKLETQNEAYRQFLAHIKSFEGSESGSVSSSQFHSKSDSLNTSLGSKLEEKIDESQKARADDNAVEESAKPSENDAKQVQEDDKKEPQIIADNSDDQDSEPNDAQSTQADDNSVKGIDEDSKPVDDSHQESVKLSNNSAKHIQADDKQGPQAIAVNNDDKDSEPNDEQSIQSDDKSVKGVDEEAREQALKKELNEIKKFEWLTNRGTHYKDDRLLKNYPYQYTDEEGHVRCNPLNWSHLHIAAYLGYTHAIEHLVTSNAKGIACIAKDLTHKDMRGNTPLHLAAFNGKIGAIDCLVRLGTTIDETNNCGETPFFLAARANQVDAMEWLVEHGADDKKTDAWQENALVAASRENSTDAIVYLAGVKHHEINDQDKHGRTALFYAARRNHQDAVKLLHKYCIDGTIKDYENRTAFHEAACAGSTEIMKFILTYMKNKKSETVDIDDKDVKGKTPLHLAAEAGQLDAVTYLVEDLHANTAKKDNKGRTALKKVEKKLPFFSCSWKSRDPLVKVAKFLQKHKK